MWSRQRYSVMSQVMHWTVALGILGMLAFGAYLGFEESGPEKTRLVQIHKSLGVIVGLLAAVRISLRMREGFALPLDGLMLWECRLARQVQITMLAATIVMPVTGILTSVTYARPVSIFGVPFIPKLLDEKSVALNELVSTAHTSIAILFGVLIALHVGGALKNAARGQKRH